MNFNDENPNVVFEDYNATKECFKLFESLGVRYTVVIPRVDREMLKLNSSTVASSKIPSSSSSSCPDLRSAYDHPLVHTMMKVSQDFFKVDSVDLFPVKCYTTERRRNLVVETMILVALKKAIDDAIRFIDERLKLQPAE